MNTRLKFLSASMFAIAAAVATQPAYASILVDYNSPLAPAGFTLTIAQQPGIAPGTSVANPGITDAAFDSVTGGNLAEGLDVDVSAPPYLNSSSFIGPDPYEYLAAEPGAPVTVTFATPQSSFDIIWGSVDSYNTLTFFDASGTAIGTFTGTDINSSAGGNQGSGGSDYVNFVDTDSSDLIAYVIASSTTPAFEFDYSQPSSPGTNPNGGCITNFCESVPEPASLSLLGAGLLALAGFAGFGASRRSRKMHAV